MKYVLVIMAVMLLAGCEVTAKLSKQKAKFICKDNGGIYLTSTIIGKYKVVCNNGKVVRYTAKEWESIVLPKEYWVEEQ